MASLISSNSNCTSSSCSSPLAWYLAKTRSARSS
jgi:hypothetical protein